MFWRRKGAFSKPADKSWSAVQMFDITPSDIILWARAQAGYLTV